MAVTKKKLLGKELVFSEEMDLFNSLRSKYLQLSFEAREKAEAEYDGNISSYSDYRNYGQSLMDDLFEQYLQMGVHDIIGYDIYDIDEVVLRDEFEREFGCAYRQAVSEFVGQMDRIDAEQRAADQERKEAIQDAGLVDGTLVQTSGNLIEDLGTMVGTAVETAAINAVAKGGTALLTGGMRAIEKRGAEKERNEIFAQGRTKNSLLNGMEQDVFLLHRVIARLINERTETEHFYYAKEEELALIEPICRNILRGNFKGKKQPDLEEQLIHRVLMTNPYELRVYCYVMLGNGGMTEELRNLMGYLCVDIASVADSYLEMTYQLTSYTTYESIVEFEKIVLKEMETFGVSTCSFYDRVILRKEMLYKERRTFHGVTYETIEDRDLAEEQYNAFVEDDMEGMNLDELLEKYETTYDPTVFAQNQIEFRMLLMQLIGSKIDEFKESESVRPYVAYAKQKQEEHQLESSELVSAFESKYKKLVTQERIRAWIAKIKEKLAFVVKLIKEKAGNLGKKLPFGKKKVKQARPEAEAAPEPQPQPEAQVVPEVKVASEPQPQPEAQVVTEVKPSPEPQATPATKTCPQCGATVKETGKFCNKCGHRF